MTVSKPVLFRGPSSSNPQHIHMRKCRRLKRDFRASLHFLTYLAGVVVGDDDYGGAFQVLREIVRFSEVGRFILCV